MSQIRVELQLQDKSFVSGVWRAGQSLKQFQQELDRTNPHFAKMRKSSDFTVLSLKRQEEQTRSLMSRMRDVAVVAGGTALAFRAITGASNGVIGSIVRVNSEMERLRYQLAGMSGAAEPLREAGRQIAGLQDLATKTPFAFNEMTTSFVKMKAAGLDPTMRSMQALTDGLAAFGATDQHLHRVTIALTQMQGKGVLSMEELRQQLGESMPNAMQLFARSMGLTVGEFAALVSTGTVEATSAIERFMSELELSYEGTGEFMMRTFSGQMSRIRTELTRLVTGRGEDGEIIGEMGNAFEMLKEKMGEFADALTTDEAKVFFDTLGLGFQRVMEFGSTIVGVFQNLREYFDEWGSTILLLFGGVALKRVITGFVASLTSARVGITSMAADARVTGFAIVSMFNAISGSARSAAMAIANTSTAASASAAAAATGASASAASALTMVGRLKAASGIFGTIALGGLRLLGTLSGVGLALSLIAPVAWEVGKGILSWATGAEDAEERIKSAGQASYEETQRIMDAQQALLEASARNSRAYLDNFNANTGDKRGSRARQIDGQQRLVEAEAALAEFMRSRETILNDALESDVQKTLDSANERIQGELRGISKSYSQAMIDADAIYKARLEEAAKGGIPARIVREEYRKSLNEIRVSRNEQIIALYNDEISALGQMEDAYRIAPEAIQELIDKRDRLQTEMENWKPEDFKVEFLVGSESEEKKLERLASSVSSARETFLELQAEINGASDELAQLLYRIERGDFGNMDFATEGTIAMRNALVETTVAAEVLQEVMQEINTANTEIERIYRNQQETNLRLRAEIDGIDPTNEFDFYQWRRENGLIDGIGDPDEVINKAIAAVTRGVDVGNVVFQNLAETIKDEAFGDPVLDRIKLTEIALQGVRDAANGISQAMSGDFLAMPGLTDATGVNPGMYAPEGASWLRYSNQSATRNKPISRDLADAMSFLEEMGIAMEVFSGGQDGLGEGSRRTGSTRHDHGGAADVRFYNGDGRMLDWRNEADIPTLQRIVSKAVERGVTGFGAGPGYMSPGSMHVGFGPKSAWGADGRSENAPSWLSEAVYGDTRGAIVNAQSVNDRTFDQAADLNQRNRALEPLAAFTRAMNEIQVTLDAQASGSSDERQGTNERQIRQRVTAGDFEGVSSEDLDALIEKAIQADKHLGDLQSLRKDMREFDNNSGQIEDQRREVERRRLDVLAQARDPNYVGRSAEMERLLSLEREQLELAERLFGVDSEQYRLEAARLAQQRASLSNAEAADALQQLARATEDSQRGAITDERELRAQEHSERLRELSSLRDRAIADAGLVADAERLYAAAVAAEKERYREENKTALQSQIDEMMKFGENINNSSVEWSNSLSDAIYNSFSDPNAFRALGDSVRESIARSLVDAAAGTLMKPFETMIGGDGTPGSGIGGIFEKLIGTLTGEGGLLNQLFSGIGSMMTGGGGGGGLLSFLSQGFTTRALHTGGIVGMSGGWAMSSAIGNFVNAPKFHSGGIVGQKMGLNSSEVPIIAQKGEGVFTPDQMKHLGGSVSSSSVTINAPVTVNASGGTPEQNADLANQMAQQTERMFRTIAQQEIIAQMRPGGMLK